MGLRICIFNKSQGKLKLLVQGLKKLIALQSTTLHVSSSVTFERMLKASLLARVHAKLLQLSLTLCNHMDHSPPGYGVGCHALPQGILPTQGLSPFS